MSPWLRLGIAAAISLTAQARGQTLDEYQVKAAFIVKFASFVEWPAGAFKSRADPFTFCVMGRNPFGHDLENLVEGRVIDGRAFVLREVADTREATGCHILFISSSERLRFRSILDSLKNSSVLPIGDANEFIAEGGIINLRVENGKVRIQIDARAAKEKSLRISSRLLDLAQSP